MHYSLKGCPTRLVPLALVMLVFFFGTCVARLSAQDTEIGDSCSPCGRQQAAAKHTALAEEALRQGIFDADKYRTQAALAIQQGNQAAAEYNAKADALLQSNTGVACGPCGEKMITPPSCEVQQEAAGIRCEGAKAQQQAMSEASEYNAKANQAIQDSKAQAVQHNLEAIRALEGCGCPAPTCNTCAPVHTCAPIRTCAPVHTCAPVTCERPKPNCNKCGK